MSRDGFWDDAEQAQKQLATVNQLKRQISQLDTLLANAEDVGVYVDLVESDQQPEFDELTQLLTQLEKEAASLETQSLLSGKHDENNCYLTLNAGAGGVDAQDWTQILYRMYTRFAEQQSFQVDLLEVSAGDEAGIKSATLHIKGLYAYGYLQAEAGVHRLVRLSPFNANNKRQTSFAGVEVVPEIEQDITLEIDPKDLRIDTYRASGAGGQHINKTDSAVRITHLPTGIVAQCQQERSQTANKETAFKLLKTRLLVLLESQHKDQLDELRGDVKENAWGNQIRSYVFHPYKMVKDLRTLHETSDVPAVMDGDLGPFIDAMLRYQAKETQT